MSIPFLQKNSILLLILLCVLACGRKEKKADSSEKAPAKQKARQTCQTDEAMAVAAVRDISARLESQKLIYNSSNPSLLQDCSGIFHQVLREMKEACPDMKAPSPNRYRASREIAYWYLNNGAFTRIRNPLDHEDLIRPGMVLFYGQSIRKKKDRGRYDDAPLDDFFVAGEGINHVGVVVEVVRDEATGAVQEYGLFHGHGKEGKQHASVTWYHKREPSRRLYPVLGNGNQPLIGAAWIIPE